MITGHFIEVQLQVINTLPTHNEAIVRTSHYSSQRSIVFLYLLFRTSWLTRFLFLSNRDWKILKEKNRQMKKNKQINKMTLKKRYCLIPNIIPLTVNSTGLNPRDGGADPRSSRSTGLFCLALFFFFLGGSLSLDTRLSDSLATAFNSGDWVPLISSLSSPSLL